MTWTTNPYATLADIKVALDIQGTTDDTWMTDLITQGQAAIDRYIGFSFQTDGTPQTPATRMYSGRGQDEMVIDRCVSLTSVTEQVYSPTLTNTGFWTPGFPHVQDITADVLLGPDNYQNRIIPSGYTLARLSDMGFMLGRQNYKVTGVFGVAIVPYDIKRACIRLATHYYKMRDAAYSDVTSEQGGVRMTYHKQMPPDVVEILESYRRLIFRAW